MSELELKQLQEEYFNAPKMRVLHRTRVLIELGTLSTIIMMMILPNIY